MKPIFIACIAALSLTGCLEITEQIAGSPPDAGQPVITCVPKTCAELNATCGAPDDGCGHSLGCGVCANGFACSSTRSCVAIETGICSVDGFCLEPGQLTTETLTGVYAVDDESVWAVGFNGTVLHRTASAGWKRLTLPIGVEPTVDLFDVKGFEPGVVWMVGENGTVLRYDETPGAGWTNFSLTASTVRLISVFGSSPSNIYAAGDETLLHFDGDTWSSDTGPADVTLQDGAVLPDGRVVVLTYDMLFTREPNASTWTSHSIFHVKLRLSVCPNGDVAVFGSYSGEGGHSQVFETTGWTQVGQSGGGGGQHGYEDGVCGADNERWAVGARDLRRSGSIETLSLQQNTFNAVDAAASGVVWAVGSSGIVYRVGADKKLERLHGPLQEGRAVLTASSRTNVWLLSTNGTSEHFDGTSWNTLASPDPVWENQFVPPNLRGVALEPNKVSVVAFRRLMLLPIFYSFDGSAWEKETLEFPADTISIHLGRSGKSIMATYRALATPDTFTVFKNDRTWTPMQVETPYVMGLSSEDELVANSYYTDTTSVLHRWTPSGWAQMSSNLPTIINTWVNGSLGYAATIEGLYVRTHLGWEPENRLPNAVFTTVQGSTANDIWVAGYTANNSTVTEPLLFHFDGTKWSPVDLGANVLVNTLYVSPTDVWVLAQGGSLLHKAR